MYRGGDREEDIVSKELRTRVTDSRAKLEMRDAGQGWRASRLADDIPVTTI